MHITIIIVIEPALNHTQYNYDYALNKDRGDCMGMRLLNDMIYSPQCDDNNNIS